MAYADFKDQILGEAVKACRIIPVTLTDGKISAFGTAIDIAQCYTNVDTPSGTEETTENYTKDMQNIQIYYKKNVQYVNAQTLDVSDTDTTGENDTIGCTMVLTPDIEDQLRGVVGDYIVMILSRGLTVNNNHAGWYMLMGKATDFGNSPDNAGFVEVEYTLVGGNALETDATFTGPDLAFDTANTADITDIAGNAYPTIAIGTTDYTNLTNGIIVRQRPA